MKTALRLLALAGVLAVSPMLSSQPAEAAQSCNSICWEQYLACKARCNGGGGDGICLHYCQEAKIECTCNCGIGICYE